MPLEMPSTCFHGKSVDICEYITNTGVESPEGDSRKVRKRAILASMVNTAILIAICFAQIISKTSRERPCDFQNPKIMSS